MTRTLIGFTGFAGAGKSTASAALVKHRGFTQLSFATPLRAMLVATGIEPEWLLERKDEIIPWLGVTGRHLMQTAGTEWGRNLVHPDFWVRLAQRRVQTQPDKRIVFDDVRFDNEARMICGLGGVIIGIRRDFPTLRGQMNHASEAGVSEGLVDRWIGNFGADKDLFSKLVLAIHDKGAT